MEKNLEIYIRRLIELDSKAVEYKKARDAELLELESQVKRELRDIDAALEDAAVISKRKHDEIISAARLQAEEIKEAANIKAKQLEASFGGFKLEAARDIWKQLLDNERF